MPTLLSRPQTGWRRHQPKPERVPADFTNCVDFVGWSADVCRWNQIASWPGRGTAVSPAANLEREGIHLLCLRRGGLGQGCTSHASRAFTVGAVGSDRTVSAGDLDRLPDYWRLGMVAFKLDQLGLGKRRHEHRLGRQTANNGAQAFDDISAERLNQPGVFDVGVQRREDWHGRQHECNQLSNDRLVEWQLSNAARNRLSSARRVQPGAALGRLPDRSVFYDGSRPSGRHFAQCFGR
jgi:hypothetical protein